MHTHIYTDTHLSHLLRCSCICMSIVIYASWRGCEPIWEQGQHTGQLICKSVAYLWVCMCVFVRACAYLWTFVPINRVRSCVRVEVNVGNRLIITVAPSFILFIEFFQAPALDVCKSHTFCTPARRPSTMCVSVFMCVPSHVRWVLTSSANQHSDPALCSRKSPNFLTSLIIPREGLWKGLQKSAFPSEWLSVNGVPMVSSVLSTGFWVKNKRGSSTKEVSWVKHTLTCGRVLGYSLIWAQTEKHSVLLFVEIPCRSSLLLLTTDLG